MKGKKWIFAGIVVLLTLVILLGGCASDSETRGKITLLFPKSTSYVKMIDEKYGSYTFVQGQTYKLLLFVDEGIEKINLELSYDQVITMATSLTKEDVQVTPTSESEYSHLSDPSFDLLYVWEYSWMVSKNLPSSLLDDLKYTLYAYNGNYESPGEAKEKNRDFYSEKSVHIFEKDEYPFLEVISPKEETHLEYGDPILVHLKYDNLKEISIAIYEFGESKKGPLGYVRSEWIPTTGEAMELSIDNYTDTLRNGNEYYLVIRGKTQQGVVNIIYRYFSFIKLFG